MREGLHYREWERIKWGYPERGKFQGKKMVRKEVDKEESLRNCKGTEKKKKKKKTLRPTSEKEKKSK